MVAVKGMKMPKSCIDCPFVKAEGTKFFCSRIMKYIDKDNLGNKHDDCPLVEIVTCEDCKHYFIDEDGCGYHCEKSDTERIPTCADFYCIHAERRE